MSNGKIETRVTIPAGGWDFEITETGGGAASASLSVPAGEYYHSSPGSAAAGLVATVQALIDASALNATYTVAIAAGEGGTGRYTISCTGGSVTSFDFTWDDTELRDLLGYTGSESAGTSITGTSQAQALWIPGYASNSLNGLPVAGSEWRGWWETDTHEGESPRGDYFGVSGERKRVNQVVWPAESRAKVWAANESLANESLEQWLIDGIWGDAAWATVGGPARIYGDAADDTVYGTYYVANMKNWRPEQVREAWVGLWEILFPRLVEVPS